jgi:imidazoleglycerol phosphate dehydratase HisB
VRTAHVERETKESHVLVELNLDGHGTIDIATGVPFFDHMLGQLGKHSGFNLRVKTCRLAPHGRGHLTCIRAGAPRSVGRQGRNSSLR